MPDRRRVFISYARSDGAQFAEWLRNRLKSEHPEITLWQDVIAMRPARDWWLQITETLDNVEYMVLVMTPDAVKSATVKKEWRYARQKGVCVFPVLGSEGLDFNALPRWMRDKHFAGIRDVKEQWELFVADLRSRCEIPRVPFMVDDLPPDFVPRPGEFEQLVKLLRDERREEPVAITAALQGAGGYGKTTLARALCHDVRIREAFDDGILWVTLGEKPGELTVKILDLIEVLSGERPSFQSLEAATARLTELLAGRDVLMVVDDVWTGADLQPFLQGGERCARLVTTRNRNTLPPKAQRVNVDAMRQDEALELLESGLQAGSEKELRALAARLGRWPLLLRLVNSVLQDRVNMDGQPLAAAIAYVSDDLDENGLTTFDAPFDASDDRQRSQAIAATLGVSLKRLGEDEARYRELAVFPEDVDVPLATVETLWSATAGLSRLKTDKLCSKLNSLSLLLRFDLATRSIRLHDVMRTYLEKQLPEAAAVHGKLLEAWGDPYHLPDDYAWRWYAYHLVEAGRKEGLSKLLLDFDWIKAKLNVTDVVAVVADYDLLPSSKQCNRVQGALRLSAHVIALDRTQLAGQLLGRLLSVADPQGIELMLQQMNQWHEVPWLRPLTGTLTKPGGSLLRILASQNTGMTAIAAMPCGKRAVSGSSDARMMLWDLETGRQLLSLDGHTNAVWALAVTSDGRYVVSGSDDRTVKVWDLEMPSHVQTLMGHSDAVWALALAADGRRLISASSDGTLRVWDLTSGCAIGLFERHASPVMGVATMADGRRVLSGSFDGELKVWDLDTTHEIGSIGIHPGGLVALASAPGAGFAVSGSLDGSLAIWDLETARDPQILRVHAAGVMALALTAEGLVISGSSDRTLKVWDLKTNREVQTFQGHTRAVRAVTVTPRSDRAISASLDATVRVWDLTGTRGARSSETPIGIVTAVTATPDGRWAISGSEDGAMTVWDLETFRKRQILRGHDGPIRALAVTPNGRYAISGSLDSTLKIWRLVTMGEVLTLRVHGPGVTSVALTPNGRRVISGLSDGTLCAWDIERGERLLTLAGHKAAVMSVAVSPDGKHAISGSADQTLKVWDLDAASEVRTLSGHKGLVRAVAVTPDGRRLLSGSFDGTLRIWDLERARETERLQGHTDAVLAVAVMPNGKLAISASDDRTLRVWDLARCTETARFTGDGGMTACAAVRGNDLLLAGDALGHFHALRLEGYDGQLRFNKPI